MYIGNSVFLVLVLISFIGYAKIFQKLRKPAWKALVPFYNFYLIYKLLEKPWWWVFLMIVPGVNIIMFGVIGYHTACYFGKRKSSELILAAIMPYLYIAYLGFSEKENWKGVDDLKKQEGGFVKNWLDPLLFAVVAATVIRTFLFEAFTIPTSSLEKSLMVGDFLFVNKFAYGPKIPQTPLAFPFAHHTLPFTKEAKSYLEWIKLPYTRLPGYGKVKNGDIVVFNYPDGDTVALNSQNFSYYQLCREFGYGEVNNIHAVNPYTGQSYGKVVARPVDKREHYVKRCVAIAGDKFEVRAGEVYINDVKSLMPENAQHQYIVKLVNTYLDAKWMDQMDIYVEEAFRLEMRGDGLVWINFSEKPGGMAYDDDSRAAINTIKNGDTSLYLLNLTAAKAELIKNMPGCARITKKLDKAGDYHMNIFPHNPNYPWNNDNFGPLVLPEAGATVNIDLNNICLYDRIIKNYERNELEIKDGKIYINGQPSATYTFKQDYYFMMGDNRHNSADSRSWGMVPFDHVVGKPVFVWFSMKDPEKNPVSGKNILGSLTKNAKDGKFRWNRFMCFVNDDGLSKSYFIHFLVIVALIWGGNKLYQKRKTKKTSA